MQGSRSTYLLTAGLAGPAFLLAVRSLDHAPDPDLVARWWVSTALVTTLLVLAPRDHLRRLTWGIALVFLAAGLVAGRGLTFSFGLAVANTAEALVVLWWLTGFGPDRPPLRAWSDYRRWLVGISVGSLVAGVLTAATLALGGTDDLWRPMLWIAVTHLGAQAVVLPLCMRQSVHPVRVSPIEVLSHLTLLTLATVACLTADESQPVAFLLLPLLMWSAARFTPRWATLELFVVSTGIAALTALGHGPFDDVTGQASVLQIAASSQSFVAISAITAVAFSVAMGHLRDSLRKNREHEVQLGQLLDSASGTAFIATDLDGLITWFSPGAEQLLGYSGSEVIGQLTPLQFHETREILRRAGELGVPPDYGVVTAPVTAGAEQDTRDWTYVRKDGSRLTVSLSATAVRDDDGRPLSHLSVVRDVTDRRAAEQALVFALDKERETNQRMQDLDRAKGEFVSSVSHELRTPLTSIVGYTELLAEDLPGTLTDSQHQLIERIDRNGDRLLHLVEDLLTLARVEDGSLQLEHETTDLCERVRTATTEVSHAAHKARVALHVNLPTTPVLMEGDAAYLERLTLNLVGNAVKFTAAGGTVEVDLSVTGDVARLTVSDNGMGIPVEEQDRVFQRFFRSSLATEHAIQGTGLGLNIVRAIAEAHHGRLCFESAPGVGSTFRFEVPVASNRPGVPDTAPVVRSEPATDLQEH